MPTSIRIPDEYEEVIREYLKNTGETMSGFAVSAMLDKIEEQIDLKAYQEAIAENKGKYSISLDEMDEELRK